MNKVTIVTISRFPEVFAQCREALDRFAPGFRRILVIDGDKSERGEPVQGYHDTRGWQTVVVGTPFSISLNQNIGLMAAWPDDVMYVCDDIKLLEPTVEELQRIAYLDPDIGIVSPRIYGSCGHGLQSAQGKNIRGDYALTTKELVSPCWFLKRALLDDIGYIDLRFNGYGGDDIDFARRAMAAGWKLAVAARIKVAHGFGDRDGSVSFLKCAVNISESVAEMHQKLIEKPWEAYLDGTGK